MNISPSGERRVTGAAGLRDYWAVQAQAERQPHLALIVDSDAHISTVKQPKKGLLAWRCQGLSFCSALRTSIKMARDCWPDQAITTGDAQIRGRFGALRRSLLQWQAYLPCLNYGMSPQPEQPHRDAIVAMEPVYGRILSQKAALA